MNRYYPAKNSSLSMAAIPVRRAAIAFVLLVCILLFLRSVSTPAQDAYYQDEKPLRIPPQARGHLQSHGDAADLSLLERLRFQYPYDLNSKFPAYIWQTWKTSPESSYFPEHLRSLEETWTSLNPDFVHEVVSDQSAEHLVRYLYGAIPEVVEAYNSMPVPVLKADLFRYLILLARGGIYSDMDTQALKSVVDWLPNDMNPVSVGLVVGIEADPDRPDWHKWYSRRIQFCQWTIQAKPGHPVLRDTVATIVEDTLRMKRKGILSMSKMDKSIVEFTGPAVWTDAVFRYLNNPEYFHSEEPRNVTYEDFTHLFVQKKVGDVAVLPITSFSPGVNQMGAEGPEHPLAFVSHQFEGTWKPENERVF